MLATGHLLWPLDRRANTCRRGHVGKEKALGLRQVRFSLDVNRARLELIPSTFGVYEPPVGRGFKGAQLRDGCSRAG